MSKLRYPTSANAVQKSLAAGLDAGVTASMTLNNATNIQNKPGVCVVDRVDSSGALKSTSIREFIAYNATSGSTLTTLTRNVDNSSSDQDHAIGAVVEFISDVTWGQAVIDALAILVDPTDVSVIAQTSGKYTTPKIITSLNDTNGNELFKVTATTSAVNELTVANAATGGAPKLSATGDDTNIELQLDAKGNKEIKLNRGYYQAFQAYSPSGGATATLDLSLGNDHRITMPAGNATIALSNEQVGQKFLISITQDSVGSRTVAWFTTIRWAGGSPPTLTTAANKRDTFGFIVTAAGTYDGFVVGQNL